jgi:hypothetical protein
MIALTLGEAAAWIGGLVLFAAIGWVIVRLIRRGYVDFGDFFSGW